MSGTQAGWIGKNAGNPFKRKRLNIQNRPGRRESFNYTCDAGCCGMSDASGKAGKFPLGPNGDNRSPISLPKFLLEPFDHGFGGGLAVDQRKCCGTAPG